MHISTQQQAIFNVGAIRLAVNLRKNLRYFPPDMQADFLTLTNFIEELDDYDETAPGNNGNENKTLEYECERDFAI